MAIDSILSLIDAEIAHLQQVRSLLSRTGEAPTKVTAIKPGKAAKKPAKAKKRRPLSAEARKRIADAQRRRWAAQKSKAKK